MQGGRSVPTTLAVIICMMIVCAMPVFLLGALFVELADDIGAPRSVLGVTVAVYWTVAASLSALAGAVTGRIGVRLMSEITLVLAAVSLMGIALWTPTWHWMLFWAVISGVAAGTQQPSVNELLRGRVPAAMQPISFGVKQAAVPLTTMLCGLAIPVVALTVGWRWAFVSAGAFGFIMLVALQFWEPRRLMRAEGAPKTVASEPLPRGRVGYYVLLAVMTALGVSGIAVMTAYGVVSAVDRGIDIVIAGVVLTIAGSLGAVVRIGVGALVPRTRLGPLRMIAILLAGGAVGMLLMSLPSPIAFCVGLVIAYAIGWGWTGLNHLWIAMSAGSATPSATGIVQTGSYLGSAAGAAFAAGLYALVGDQMLWVVAAVLMVAGASLAVIAARRPVLKELGE